MKLNVLAFDFGASSGRAIVGKYDEGQLDLEEVHRFSNYPKEINGVLKWDLEYLFQQIIEGIKIATSRYEIKSLGIDTWGVDFGLIDQEGNLLENPTSYRDQSTKGILEIAQKSMALKDIYQLTGNQLMEINSLFQLIVIKENNPALLDKIDKMLFMPDLFNYLLTGEKRAERSIASTSQLIDIKSKQWSSELFEKFALPEKILPELIEPGQFVGKIRKDLNVPELDVLAVCEHDTASAVVSIPSIKKFLFVSCGTWSLVGTELKKSIINKKAQNYNLTNESGFAGTTTFLKNLTGLWIIQEMKRNLAAEGRDISFSEMAKLASNARPFTCLIDTDFDGFMTPGNMFERIKEYARQTQQTLPQTDGEFFRCVYESLAMKYKYTFLEISDAADMEFDSVNIVGGGANVKILCQMVADAANLQVSAGPAEATGMGNIIVQLIAEGIFKNLAEAREWLMTSTKVNLYFPNKRAVLDWDNQFSNYQKILKMKGIKVDA